LQDEKRGEKKLTSISRLHLTPDDRTVLVLGRHPDNDPRFSGGIAARWDLATGRRLSMVKIEPLYGYDTAFSPDGAMLASWGELLDTASGKARFNLESAGRGASNRYAFSADGRLVVGLVTSKVQEGTAEVIKPDGTRVWNAATGKEVVRLPTNWVGQYTFTPDARYLATGSMDGIRLWELLTGKVVLMHPAHEKRHGAFQSFASSMVMAPNGRSLATGHADGTILIWGLTPPPGATGDLPQLWSDLAGPDAAKAYTASWHMTQVPDATLPYLRKCVGPATAAPAEQTGPLLAGLDGQDFKKREESARQLRALSDRAAGAMRQALKANHRWKHASAWKDCSRSWKQLPLAKR
jgi:hypothetical protein